MKRLALIICAAGLALVGAGSATSASAAVTLCVGGPGCFSTIQAAVDAAQDGDAITIAPGTFAGGITIDVSVALVGAGANRTIIKGGGPVLTIGQQGGPRRTVSIQGVTITGGVNNSMPDTVVTFGGGVSIPWSAGFTTGATVAIADSVITGNRVAPQTTAPAGDFCGPAPCAYALGGGIDNAGTLTVTNTRISDNQAGSTRAVVSLATGAGAGGIFNEGLGTLTLRHSSVIGNRAAVNAPFGAFAVAGGIDGQGPVTIEDGVVSDNSVDVSSALPTEFGQAEASAGGILVGASATIARTVVHRNTVTAVNVAGDALAFAGGIHVDGSLVLTESTVDHNQAHASVPPSSGSTAIAAQGGLSVGGVATVRNSLISGNSASADSVGGVVLAGGGGIGSFGQLTLERTVVSGNTATANGASGSLQGGGITNFTLGGPPPQLTLTDSAVVGNRLSGSPGVTLQGGGLFTAFPITRTRTVIAGNTPDQCFGLLSWHT
jgi:hypothetical protein